MYSRETHESQGFEKDEMKGGCCYGCAYFRHSRMKRRKGMVTLYSERCMP